MVLRRLLVLTLGLLLAGVGLPAHAQEPQPTSLTLDSVVRFADLETPVGVTLLSAADEAPIAGAQVVVERRIDEVWAEVGVLVADEAGRAELAQTLARDASDNVFRATYAGDVTWASAESGRYVALIERRDSVATVGGPARVVDEQTVECSPTPGLGWVRRDLG